MATLVARLLDVADTLIEERPRSAAFRRRAISSAYYGLFHALAKTCAQSLLPTASRGGADYARIYRALDHGPAKTAFSQSPLKDGEQFRRIGDIFVRMQSERHKADYAPPDANLFPLTDTKKLIELARQAVELIERLDERDRCLLAACILFKSRPAA